MSKEPTINELEDKLQKLENMLEISRTEEENLRKRKSKEKEDKEKRLEKKRKLEESWKLMRWITDYIEQNGDKWKTEENDLIEEEKNPVSSWNKMQKEQKIDISKSTLGLGEK